MSDVSLVVPCYNVERYISETLDSFFELSPKPKEIICVNDGSVDSTRDICKSYDVKIVDHGGNNGLAVARNTGVKEARGEFIAFLDADCCPESDWLGLLFHEFTNEKVAGVGGRLMNRFVESRAERWREVHVKQNWGDKLRQNPRYLSGSNNIYRKKALLEVGLFNPIYKTNYEDVDISTRLMESGWTLIYAPSAKVWHLRRDDDDSVLRMLWGHRQHSIGSFSTSSVIKRLARNFGSGFIYTIEDFVNMRLDFLSLDLRFGFNQTRQDYTRRWKMQK
ncbi:glycosyltransferase [Candidatus Altiarchaeota archaeon]